MKKNSDLIKHYAVKIECDFGKSGSGVLIKIDNNRCYLATAKHNFTTKERDDSWRDVKKGFLEKHLSDISISQNKKKICKIINILSFCDGYDVILFEVKDFNEEFKRLSKVNILYEKDYGKEHEYFFHGYPSGAKNDSDEIIEKLYIKNNNEYTYTLGTNEPFRKNGIKGFSGSGVFIQDNNRLYLVGIIIHRNDDLSSFTAFNLPRYIKEKESSLDCLLRKNILDLENLKDMQDLIIYRNPNNPLIQEYKNIFQGDKSKASKLPDKAKEIGYLGKKFQITNQFIEIEANFRKELADMYLLATIISKKFGEETLVKEYFEKAIEYEPRYIRYLKDIKIEYSIDELMKDAKIALIEDRFNDAKIFFKALLYLNINDNQRIYCYEKILEIVKIQNNDIEIIETSMRLLSLYLEDLEEEKLKKAVIYYDLSIRDKLKQLKYVNSGLSEIQEYTTNPTFFEIQYKLKRRKNELLGIKEDILQTEDSYLDLRENLEKLSSTNKNYNGEYQQIVLKENYKDIIYKQKSLEEKYKDTIKKISTKILIGVFIAITTLPFLIFILINTLDITNKQYHIDKNITKCNQKDINSFKVEECYFKEDNKSKAIIYDINSSSKAIVLQGFPSGKSNFSQNKKIFLKDIFHYRLDNLKQIKNIKVYGHTDLQHIKKQYDNNISSNRDLGSARALKVKEVISEEISRKIIETKYNPDFFMRDTDKILKGKLLKVLGLDNEVNRLIQELNISNESNISIEHIEKIRNKFKYVDLSKYKIRFAPFRSVIILINLKEESLIDKYIRKFLQFFKNIPPREKLISNIDVISINNSTQY